ncbi:GntR family transcriptional regulator [Bacillus sp. V5-8f]|uniref:GntR family transcriptional regulator n=1 Tax=Bacillus sp. V5-8f TaxID=2053044 RepID=UPI000C773EF4|nr:GntR family transcriptional regulator [Bacillus sp. V5-8f]PLT34460.1 GntR family transcriptional regulator [Bacillus sp. V5-8f]
MDPYKFIKESIIHGRFEPGFRLTEEFLAKELGISRTPIREAIKQLEAEDLITPLKRGVIVRQFTKEDIRQIYDIRSLLEGYAASQAAIHRTDEDMQRMEEANQRYGQTIDRYLNSNSDSIDEIVTVNQDFHESIVAASKNQQISYHISKVVVVPLIFRSFYWYKPSQIRRSHETHNAVLEAIKSKDAERARIALQEHIYQGRDHVFKHLDSIEFQFLTKEEA